MVPLPALSSDGTDVPISFAAAVVLMGLHVLRDTGLALPTASDAIAALGGSRAAAYATCRRLQELLPTLVRQPGRPTKPEPEPASPTELAELQGAVLDYLLRHPGAASQGEHRRRYTHGFRIHILELANKHTAIPLADFAHAVRVPLGTLRDWLAGGSAAVGRELDKPNAAEHHERLTHSRLVDVLNAHQTWAGTFLDFCKHVQQHLRIPFSRALIGDVLEAEGVRKRRRRPGRRDADAEALRGKFQTFITNGQAVADGSVVAVQVGDEIFSFNIELVVDAHTAAWTGLAITPTEDADALLSALDDAHHTTGSHPEALLVDNKPSNHTPEVRETLEQNGTIPIRATSRRAENKAHCEGAFGLFKDRCPDLVLDPTDPASLAQQLLEHVVVTFARALNHRPRRAPDKRSRVEQFEQDTPTDEERAAAREALKARAKQQERAHQRAARALDPVLRQHLDDAFAELGLDDPDARFRVAIGRYHADAVAAGLAIFRTKQARGTLPDGVDARYLLGIVRNTAHTDEGYAIADAIWKERLAIRDRALDHLDLDKEQLELDADDLQQLLVALVDHAMAAERRIDRAFWLRAAADLLLEEPLHDRTPLFRLAARRIHTTLAVPHRKRLDATRRLAAMALSIAPAS
ncbi:MAG: hypothetical protein ABFS46_09790 [Myxococcota bacterium]